MIAALFRWLRLLGTARALSKGPTALGRRSARRAAHRSVRRLFR